MLIKVCQENPVQVQKQFVEFNSSFAKAPSLNSTVKYGMPVSFGVSSSKVKKSLEEYNMVGVSNEGSSIFTAPPQVDLTESAPPYKPENNVI